MATLDDWQKAAAKEVKGADLTWDTPEGIPIKPLYTAADVAGVDPGLPGFFPTTVKIMVDGILENHTGAIVIGAEGVTQRTPAIRIEGNIFHRDGDYPTAFVVNLTATEAELVGNKVAPGIKPLTGDGTVH